MKLTEKEAIELLNEGWAVENDGELKKLQRLIKKAIDSKSEDQELPSGETKFYFLIGKSWMCCDETKRPTFKLSDVVFKKKKSKLDKRVERLEKSLKTERERVDYLYIDKQVVGVEFEQSTGCSLQCDCLKTPLNAKDLVKGKWYGRWGDNCKQAFKHSHFDRNKDWYCSESNLAEEHKIELDCWMWADSYKELTQEELDSFLPEGHEDRSDSKPTDFNTNTKYRKKGDVCLVWSEFNTVKSIAIWNKTGFEITSKLEHNYDYDNHKFLGVNILDHE